MLPKERREEVIELKKLHRLAPQAIASRTGVPLATVRKWLKALPLTAGEKRA
jgi:DNA-directed RNA polymerase specialized sigma24 family protein